MKTIEGSQSGACQQLLLQLVIGLRKISEHQEIMAINKTIKISSWERNISHLVSVLDQDTFKECQAFISRVRESRNRHVKEGQVVNLTGCGLKY